MPSPFPGMDPYLEQRALWPDLHQRLIAYSAEALQGQLRPSYVVRIGERIEVAGVARTISPDVLIVKPTPEPPSGPPAGNLVADEPITIAVLDEERRVPFLEIIDPATHAVITLIEVLSPANKSGDGRGQFLQKQEELLASQVHFVEIDLLGYGTPTVLARNSLSTPRRTGATSSTSAARNGARSWRCTPFAFRIDCRAAAFPDVRPTRTRSSICRPSSRAATMPAATICSSTIVSCPAPR